MIIYYVSLAESTVEFLSEQDASTYAALHGAEVQQLERELPATVQMPNITSRQLRLAIILSNISLSEISAALDSLEEPTKSLALVEWEYSTIFEFDNPLLAQVVSDLGWTNQQLTDLWTLAAGL